MKNRVKIWGLWYNLRSPAIQSYFVAYEQAKKDADIEEEMAARLRAEQLQGLKKIEKNDQKATRPIRNVKSSSGGG